MGLIERMEAWARSQWFIPLPHTFLWFLLTCGFESAESHTGYLKGRERCGTDQRDTTMLRIGKGLTTEPSSLFFIGLESPECVF
jgi:hypothetical protein